MDYAGLDAWDGSIRVAVLSREDVEGPCLQRTSGAGWQAFDRKRSCVRSGSSEGVAGPSGRRPDCQGHCTAGRRGHCHRRSQRGMSPRIQSGSECRRRHAAARRCPRLGPPARRWERDPRRHALLRGIRRAENRERIRERDAVDHASEVSTSSGQREVAARPPAQCTPGGRLTRNSRCGAAVDPAGAGAS
jgi:hypothetical protein